MHPANSVSRAYAWAQTVLLCLFAAAVIFGGGVPLFTSVLARDVGLALCAVGLTLMAFAFVPLREVIQIAPEPKAGAHLVTTGIYRWLRHPIYTAIVLIVIGLVLRKPGLWLAIAAAVVIAFLFVKTRFEERLLETHYPEYSEYRKRSWGLIPGLR